MYFPQISNKRVPSSVQKSQKQARPKPKHGSPHPSDSPFVLRGRKNYLSTSRETPRPPSATPFHPSTAALLHHAGADTPTSSSTSTSTAMPSTLVVEAEAEPSVPEPVQPRRPAPHRYRSNFATVHRTGAIPATPSFAASDLLPLRRHTATATQSTIWPWVRPRLHPPPKHRLPRQIEEYRRDIWRTPHWQLEMVLLFPYS